MWILYAYAPHIKLLQKGISNTTEAFRLHSKEGHTGAIFTFAGSLRADLQDITSLPHVPGHELAGIIASVGKGVEGWQAGNQLALRGVSIPGGVMRKIFLLVSVFGSLLVSCGDSVLPAATGTAVPSPVPPVTVSQPMLIEEIELETQTGTAYGLEWSPDGEMLAVASGYEITLLRNDLKEPYTVLKPEDGAITISWNPDQNQFATVLGFRNPTIKLWDWDTVNHRLTLAREIQAGADQYGVFWSPDGKRLASLADDDKSTFQIWDASTGTELHTYELPYTNPLRTSSWSADSATLYAAGESNGQMIVYGLAVADGSIREIAKLDAAKADVFALSPNANILAIGDERGAVEFLDLASGKVLAGIKTVDQPVDLGWSPDGGSLAVLGYKATLQLWDTSP